MQTTPWKFFNPVRICFKVGAIELLSDLTQSQRAVLITSAGFVERGMPAKIEKMLPHGLAGVVADVSPNPDITHLEAQRSYLREFQPTVLIALGGGSTIDSAKALARLSGIDDNKQLRDHLNDKLLPTRDSLPIIAIPTTSGTGSEVTPFATIWDFESGKKHSLSGDDLYPSWALLDPGLTDSLPWPVAASSGLDALSHSLESIWNRFASPISLPLSRQAARLCMKTLGSIANGNTDLATRASMMHASLLAGLSISQTRTALAHSISYPLTSRLQWPHGIASSFTLPALLQFNAKSDDGRLQHLASELGHNKLESLVFDLQDLLGRMRVKELLSPFHSSTSEVLSLVDDMFTPERAHNNLREASRTDVVELVTESLNAIS